jgi:hypothetical protein
MGSKWVGEGGAEIDAAGLPCRIYRRWVWGGEGRERWEQIRPCTKCSLHACSFTLCLSFSYLRSAVTASFDIKKFHRNATRTISIHNVVYSLRGQADLVSWPQERKSCSGEGEDDIRFVDLEGGLRAQWRLAAEKCKKYARVMAVSWRMVEGGGRLWRGGRVTAQIRQSAKLFLMSSELGLPHPLTPWWVCSPSFVLGGGGVHTRLREREWGSPSSSEGTDTMVLVYIYFVGDSNVWWGEPRWTHNQQSIFPSWSLTCNVKFWSAQNSDLVQCSSFGYSGMGRLHGS